MELTDRLVLVTGAGSGIGEATALAMAGAGARVVAVDIDGDRADKTAAACAERGPAAWGRRCDVADRAGVEEMAQGVFDEIGVPDVVVNNAGVGMAGPFDAMTLEDWAWIRSINLDGVVHGCHAFGPPMLRRGSGHLINLSSGLAYTIHATEPAYITTKAAVLALSRCLDADWGRRGVPVTAICPGVITTGIIDRSRFPGDAPEERRAEAARLFRRGHSPDLVAAAIVASARHPRAVVPVGWEARLGWLAHRFVPVRLGQLGARLGSW